MRKVVLYIAMSLDGYIADREGGVQWLGGDGSDPEHMGTYAEFIETVDTVILGYTTYNQIVTELSPDVWPYAGKRSYVMTHKAIESTDEIVFTKKNLDELIKELKQGEGKDIWVCGGPRIVNQLMQLDFIDQYHITVMPTLLGEGIRLFDTFKEEKKLTLLDTKVYNGMVELIYTVRD